MENEILRDERYVVKFSKPVKFEDKEYTELDLSALEDVSTDELMTVEKMYTRAGGTSVTPETTLLYSVILASVVTNTPIEFFGVLRGKESMKIKKVCNYFLLKPE